MISKARQPLPVKFSEALIFLLDNLVQLYSRMTEALNRKKNEPSAPMQVKYCYRHNQPSEKPEVKATGPAG